MSQHITGRLPSLFVEVGQRFARLVVVTETRKVTRGMTLDRYPDPDGNYEPGNVRWATKLQQARNRSAS